MFIRSLVLRSSDGVSACWFSMLCVFHFSSTAVSLNEYSLGRVCL